MSEKPIYTMSEYKRERDTGALMGFIVGVAFGITATLLFWS